MSRQTPLLAKSAVMTAESPGISLLRTDTEASASNLPTLTPVADLPDLMDRIRNMGLVEEYSAFRERYLGWRQGEARGARGEPTAGGAMSALTSTTVAAANRGWGYWYPTVEEWQWKRTMSYWIAITFFEGSIFFAVSSFLYNYPHELGEFFESVTIWGYVGGKINYVICTYLMCMEIVNLNHVQVPESPGGAATTSTSEGFRYWPFACGQALRNLKSAGLGPWPYYAAALYFIGCLLFTVGLLAEMLPGVPLEIVPLVVNCSFTAGSMCFVLGGLSECIENKTFTSLKLDKGWFGALLNFLGSSFFLFGALLGFVGDGYWSDISFGVGAIFFLIGSSLQIIMWKDEQFGLTFLAVLNSLGGVGPHGRPMLAASAKDRPKEATFSVRGCIFIHLYCVGGALSWYNFMIQMQLVFNEPCMKFFCHAFNELLPCFISHMLLILSSAVVEMPKARPYKQLVVATRWVFMGVLANSAMTFCVFLREKFASAGHQ